MDICLNPMEKPHNYLGPWFCSMFSLFFIFEAGTMNLLISRNQSDDNETVMMKPAVMKIEAKHIKYPQDISHSIRE